MTREGAPIYVRAHDLALDLHRMRVDRSPDLARALRAEGRALLCEVSLALTFVDGRAAHVRAADHALARLKVLVRLAHDVGTIDLAARERLGGEIVTIGRMIGGWRRHQPPPGEAPFPARGG